MDMQVSAWALWLVLSLAACGFLAVCWVVAGWAERAADWWHDRRGSVEELDSPCGLCGSMEPCEHDEPSPPPLPPERTWEQMTSHQLPIERPRPAYPARFAPHPAYEAEARAHYVAMGFEYPSGLLARVRELTP